MGSPHGNDGNRTLQTLHQLSTADESGVEEAELEGVLRYRLLRCRKTRSKGLALFMLGKTLPPGKSMDT